MNRGIPLLLAVVFKSLNYELPAKIDCVFPVDSNVDLSPVIFLKYFLDSMRFFNISRRAPFAHETSLYSGSKALSNNFKTSSYFLSP